MVQAGQVVLFHFPQTDLTRGKLRPAIILDKLPGSFDDWLICMISSQTRHYIDGFDVMITTADADYAKSGLKHRSVIRTGRLAVVDEGMLLGAIGEIDSKRLAQVKVNLVNWLNTSTEA